MTKILLSLILIFWPLGHLSDLPEVLGMNWTALDLLLGLVSISLFVSHRRKIFTDPLFKPLSIFTLLALVSLLINLFRLNTLEILTATGYLVRFISSISVYFAIRQTKPNRRLLIASIISFVGLGLAQYLLIPDMRFLKNFGYDDHYYRLVGSLLDPNFTGLILTQITLIAMLSLKGRSKLLSIIPLAALSLTFSRASFLTFAVVIVYLFIRSKGRHFNKYLPVYLAVLIFFMWLVPKPFGEGVNLLRTFSITSRINNQQQALNLFLERPLFGWGFNTLSGADTIVENRVGGFDNSFLYVLATTGAVGFSAFLYLLYRIWKLIRLNSLMVSVFIAVLIHSLFNNSFFFLWESVFFWSLLGLRDQKTPHSK